MVESILTDREIIWSEKTNEDIKNEIAASRLVLWDLDGTLFESAPGIYNGLLYAVDRLQLKRPDDKVLRSMIGPPLRDSFQKNFGLTAKEADVAVSYYRRYYVKKGLYEVEPYPGVGEILAALKDQGKILTLATSKPWVFAHRILRRYNLRSYFDTIFGAYRNGRLDTKAEVIEAVVRRYPEFKTSEMVMIGDRYHDVTGALAYNIRTIGVSYGYGTVDELLTSGAAAVVHTPYQVLKLLS